MKGYKVSTYQLVLLALIYASDGYDDRREPIVWNFLDFSTTLGPVKFRIMMLIKAPFENCILNGVDAQSKDAAQQCAEIQPIILKKDFSYWDNYEMLTHWARCLGDIARNYTQLIPACFQYAALHPNGTLPPPPTPPSTGSTTPKPQTTTPIPQTTSPRPGPSQSTQPGSRTPPTPPTPSKPTVPQSSTTPPTRPTVTISTRRTPPTPPNKRKSSG